MNLPDLIPDADVVDPIPDADVVVALEADELGAPHSSGVEELAAYSGGGHRARRHVRNVGRTRERRRYR
jgi:hypothetical protein